MAIQIYNRIGYTNQDKELAFNYCMDAASKGLAHAQNLLGNFFIEGFGTVIDADQGMSWYIKAGEQREATAIYNIGTMFERGIGVAQSFSEACKWFSRAADLDCLNAHNVLGILHEQGIISMSDPSISFYHYQEAALKGHVNALYNLARLYNAGFGTEKNDHQAFVCFEYAARQGHGMAQLSTAICLEYGIGTTRDKKRSLEFYEMAACNSVEEAKTRLTPQWTKNVLKAANYLLLSEESQDSKRKKGIFSLPVELRLQIINFVNTSRILSDQDMKEIISDIFDTGDADESYAYKMEQSMKREIRKVCSCAEKECNRIIHIVYGLGNLEIQ